MALFDVYSPSHFGCPMIFQPEVFCLIHSERFRHVVNVTAEYLGKGVEKDVSINFPKKNPLFSVDLESYLPTFDGKA